MSANAKKEMNELIRKLKQHGITCKQLPNGHWRTDSDPPLTFSFSPSDVNAARAAARDVRKHLGIDIRLSGKRKDSANDFAMNRLRERTLKQAERGASVADLARLAVAESEDKRIGGWESLNAAEVGISGVLRGNRLVKQNHDALAAAVGKLEHADDKAFVKHLDKTAERFGKKRIAKLVESEQDVREVFPPVESEPEAAEPEQDVTEFAEALRPARIRGQIASATVPAKVEVTVKIEIGDETRRLIKSLLGSRG